MQSIIILGNEPTIKNQFFKLISERYGINEGKNKIFFSPKINWSERKLKLNGKIFKLINTPVLKEIEENEFRLTLEKTLEKLIREAFLLIIISESYNFQEIFPEIKKKIKNESKNYLFISKEITKVSEKRKNVFIFNDFIKGKKFNEIIETYSIEDKQEGKIKQEELNEDLNSCEKEEEKVITIFGPPNSGKSTLVNLFLSENRSLVTPISGTTQEPVISDWSWKKENFCLIDTAGINGRLKEINYKLWKKTDVFIALIDGSLSINNQILQIISLQEKFNKPLILLINKCDLLKNKEEIIEQLNRRLQNLQYCPIIAISALKKKGIHLIFEALRTIMERSKVSINKRELNETSLEITEKIKTEEKQSIKIYFIKYEKGLNPKFIFFLNNPDLLHFSRKRFIVNYLRKKFSLTYLPITVAIKKSK